MKANSKQTLIETFNFRPGRLIAKKYEIIRCLGNGWEGEVYLLKEKNTGIERAGKFFFPHRNRHNRAVNRYAQKLHRLRHCPIMIQYAAQEIIRHRGQEIRFLISEYVEGKLLSEFIAHQPGKRLPAFQALHLLHALAKGMEGIHRLKEYHGDLHMDNIIVQRFGLGFELKLLDLFHWDPEFSKQESIRDDICDMIKIFYDALGGRKYYAKQPRLIKAICCGLKRTLILKKFKNTVRLYETLENLEWND